MNTKALRQKILDLAIRGKLVPQDPNDEPASVLLERIRTEKERLIKEGKIKRPKKAASSDTPHYENVPFEVPESWEWVTLEEYANKITDFVASGSFASLRENVKYYNTINYAILVRTKDFQTNFKGNLVYTDYHGYEFLENSRLFGGEIILPNIGASIGKSFIVPYLKQPMTLAPNSILIRTREDIETSWLLAFFRSRIGIDTLHNISSSTAQGKFNKTDLKRVLVPLSPFSEQRRIIAEIEKWFALIDEIEDGQQDLSMLIEQAKSKVLDLAIHGKLVPQNAADEPAEVLLKRINPQWQPCDTSHYGNLPYGWTYCQIRDLANILNGFAFKSSEYVEKGLRIIRITNVQDGYIEDDAPKFYPEKTELEPYLLEENDLLMSLTGNVGRVGLMPKSMLPAALNQRVACVRTDEGVINKHYLFYLFQSKTFCDACIASAKGVAQLNVSTEWLKQHSVPLPPYTEQSRIVERIEELLSIISSINQTLAD